MNEAKEKKKGKVTVLCAPFYNGALWLSHMEELFIGTDANSCGLIVEGCGISRKHSYLSYNAVSDTFLLMDLSLNGTYLADGKRLPPHYLMELDPGTEFYLSEPENRIRVG